MDLIAFISRSRSRVAVLASLADGPKHLHEVVGDVDSPRTTVRDNIKQLIDHGLVEEDTGRQYHPTTTGALVFEAYRNCEEETAVIERLEPFLEHVPFDALPGSVAVFRNATLVTRSRSNPCRVISTLMDLVSDRKHVRAVMPAVPGPVSDAVFDSSGTGPQTVQILTADDESLDDRSAASSIADVRIKSTDQPLPFGLVVDEEQVTVYCLDDEMVTRALIHVDDDDACGGRTRSSGTGVGATCTRRTPTGCRTEADRPSLSTSGLLEVADGTPLSR
jgi:predicted transcriptional regulator